MYIYYIHNIYLYILNVLNGYIHYMYYMCVRRNYSVLRCRVGKFSYDGTKSVLACTCTYVLPYIQYSHFTVLLLLTQLLLAISFG